MGGAASRPVAAHQMDGHCLHERVQATPVSVNNLVAGCSGVRWGPAARSPALHARSSIIQETSCRGEPQQLGNRVWAGSPCILVSDVNMSLHLTPYLDHA